MKKQLIVPAAAFAAIMSRPELVWACAVCFDANSETRGAFVGTTIFLSLLPLAIIGIIILWLYQAVRAAETQDEPGVINAVAVTPEDA